MTLGGRGGTKILQMTREELLALPPTCDLEEFSRAWGISLSSVYRMKARGQLQELDIRINKLGGQWRVITSDLLAALGVEAD